MKTLGYYDGHYDEIENMQIPMRDRSHWFGDGVYDATIARHYHIYSIGEHIDRFFNSAALVGIEVPVTKDALRGLLEDLIRKLDTGDLFVYFQVTRGGGALRGHAFQPEKSKLWVTFFPDRWDEGETPISVITQKDRRFHFCNVKTLNLLPSVLAAEAAKKAGGQEAILYRPGGRVTECAHSNCHILKDGVLITAPADDLILPGIARAHLLKKCRELGIPTAEVPYTLEELFAADEVLVTASSDFCLRVEKVDGKPVGGRAPELYEQLRSSLVADFLRDTE